MLLYSHHPVFVNVTFIKSIIFVINNIGTSLSELQVNFGMLQIDTENSATGFISIKCYEEKSLFFWEWKLDTLYF